jgi:hypothetical protein
MKIFKILKYLFIILQKTDKSLLKNKKKKLLMENLIIKKMNNKFIKINYI